MRRFGMVRSGFVVATVAALTVATLAAAGGAQSSPKSGAGGGTGTSAPSSPSGSVTPAAPVPAPVGPFGYTNGRVFNEVPFGPPRVEGCRFYKVGLGNAVAEEIDDDFPCVDGLTFSASGVLYAFTVPVQLGTNGQFHSDLVTIDPATGDQTIVGDMGFGFFGGAMTFDKDGNLWLYAENSQPCAGTCFFRVNPATGAATKISDTIQGFVGGLAANCSAVYAAGVLQVPKGLNAPPSLFTVDAATGGLTLVGALDASVFPDGLDFAADGTLYAIGDPLKLGNGNPIGPGPRVLTISTTTGKALTEIPWVSEDSVPNFTAGLAIAGVSCPVPPSPGPPVIQPTFTG